MTDQGTVTAWVMSGGRRNGRATAMYLTAGLMRLWGWPANTNGRLIWIMTAGGGW